MIGGVTVCLEGLLSLPGRVTLSAGVTICHVNVSRWGNLLSRGLVHVKFPSAPRTSHPSESSFQHSRAERLDVNAGYFSATAEGVISTTWGSPSPIKQALKHFEDSLR